MSITKCHEFGITESLVYRAIQRKVAAMTGKRALERLKADAGLRMEEKDGSVWRVHNGSPEVDLGEGYEARSDRDFLVYASNRRRFYRIRPKKKPRDVFAEPKKGDDVRDGLTNRYRIGGFIAELIVLVNLRTLLCRIVTRAWFKSQPNSGWTVIKRAED